MTTEQHAFRSLRVARVDAPSPTPSAPVQPKFTRGVLGKYAKVVQSAAHGAVCG